AAGAAPRSPEIDEDGLAARLLDDVGGERLGGCVLNEIAALACGGAGGADVHHAHVRSGCWRARTGAVCARAGIWSAEWFFTIRRSREAREARDPWRGGKPPDRLA